MNTRKVGTTNMATDLMATYRKLQEDAEHGMAVQMTPVDPDRRQFINKYSNASNPKRLAYRNQVVKECDRIKETCHKKLLLDIYMKVLPLDDDYYKGNRGQCCQDVDDFLGTKDQTAVQYFQSACKETKAPLLEYLTKAIDGICVSYMEDADKKASEEEEATGKTPDDVPEAEEEEIDSQLVDVTSDDEYEDFIEVLKKKTVRKIVDDISEMITANKDDKEMEFDIGDTSSEGEPTEEPTGDDTEVEADAGGKEEPTEEEAPKEESVWVKPDRYAKMRQENSSVIIGMNHLMETAARKGYSTKGKNDAMVGLVIREATLLEIDRTFNQPMSDPDSFRSRIRFNRGYLMTEATITKLFTK